MGPRKTTSDWSNESGYPGVLYKLCKEEDVLIIPQFVTYSTGRKAEQVSPKKSKELKNSKQKLEKFGSNSLSTNDSKVDDLLGWCNLRPPQLNILYENPDNKDTPIAIICKNFYIEFSLLSAIGRSLKSYPAINCLKIENCCISANVAEALALLLAEELGKRISDVSLDGNEEIFEVLPLFIKFSTGVRHLSLQRCSLDDNAIKALVEPLGFTDDKEHKLQVLNLSMNKIGNAGVSYIAKALRTNRSLISISLAGNQIGDEGVDYLIEVLQKFRLTHEEVVLRRKRIFDTIFKKKNEVEKYIEEWKIKGEIENHNSKMSIKSAERTGRKVRGPDGKIRCLSSRDRRNKPNTVKLNSGEKFRGKIRAGTDEVLAGAEPTPFEIMAIVQQVESEMTPDKHPFVNEGFANIAFDAICSKVESLADKKISVKHITVSKAENALWCMGCWSLGNLNLGYNYLSEASVKKFTEIFYFQSENFAFKTGLLRLVLLPGNLFQDSSVEFQKLQSSIIYRNSRKDIYETAEVAGGGSLSPVRRRTSSGRKSKGVFWFYLYSFFNSALKRSFDCFLGKKIQYPNDIDVIYCL